MFVSLARAEEPGSKADVRQADLLVVRWLWAKAHQEQRAPRKRERELPGCYCARGLQLTLQGKQ